MNRAGVEALSTRPQVDTSKYYCPFQDRGFCREPSRCNFSHDTHESTKIPNDYCHFYLANQCLYGQDCKFIHGEPDAEQLLVEGFANISFEGGNNDATESYDHFEELGGGCGVRDEGSSNNTITHDCDEDDDEGSYEPLNTGEHNNNGSDRDERPSQQQQPQPTRGFCGFTRDQMSLFLPPVQDQTATARQQQQPQQQRHKVETNQGSSSRLRATLSHRCTSIHYNAHATSSSSKLSQESARSTSSGPQWPKIITTTTTATITTTPSTTATSSLTSNTNSARSSSTSSSSSTLSKPAAKTWQGGRLIASIRSNNLVEEHPPQAGKGSGGAKSGGSAEEAAKDLPLCPYALASGDCPFPYGQCSYLHGEACDLCGSLCLHPFNESQRLQHRDECLREIEREMELSFAVQRSKDKVCGICMDTVMEKKPITSSRFGILEKCNHIFCLDCIRKWRGTKQFDSRTIRACPECRVSSDFVVPSKYWVEDQDDKDKLIQDYKSALRAKPCRYFNEGKGDCPFAGSCFYRHAYPDGRLAEMEAPKPRRRLYGARGLASDVANYIFWNFISAADDDLSEDGVDSSYDWEMASIYEEDGDEELDYGYDV